MILMWLGSFVLMLFGLTESQKYFAQFFSESRNGLLKKGITGNTGVMFLRALAIAVTDVSPQKSLRSGFDLYSSASTSKKGSILLMCLSTMGVWWALILGLLFLGLSGLFVIGFCALGLVRFWTNPKVEMFLKWIFSAGLFLVGGELMLRNSSIVQTLLGQSDLAFFLADGRFFAVLGLMLAGIILSLFVRIEFWSLALVLGLLVTNALSFNGALGLVAGERIGQLILFWWLNRSKNSSRIAQQFALVSIIGIFVGLLIVAEARSAFYFGLSTDMSALQNKTYQFVIAYSLILFFQWLGQMVWGHFAGQAKV